MKKLFPALALLLIAAAGVAAQTNVTGTITDANGIPYNLGKIRADLIPTGGPQPCAGTNPCVTFQSGQTATLSSTGSFQMNLYPNSTITPGGTQWQFTVTEPGVSYEFGTGPQTFIFVATIPNLATVDISSGLSALAPTLTRPLTPGPGTFPRLDQVLNPIFNKTFNLGTTTLGFSNGAVDLSAATTFRVPNQSPCATTLGGQICWNPVSGNWHVFDGLDNFLAKFPSASPPNSGEVAGFLKTTNNWTLQDLGSVNASAGNTFWLVNMTAPLSGDVPCWDTSGPPFADNCTPGAADTSIAGATSTYLVSFNDQLSSIDHDSAGSASVTITLPTADTLGLNPGFVFIYSNHSTHIDTITPTTWTINGGATLTVNPNTFCRTRVDPKSATNWYSDCATMGGFPTLNQVLDPTANKTFAMGAHSLEFDGDGSISTVIINQSGSGGANAALSISAEGTTSGPGRGISVNADAPLTSPSAGVLRAIEVGAGNSGTANLATVQGLQVQQNYNNNGSGGTVTDNEGIWIDDQGGVGTNNYGIFIKDQAAGATNWAIKTGLGKVQLGDALTLDSTTASQCLQTNGSKVVVSSGGPCGNLSGTLTSGKVPVASGANALSDGSILDDGTHAARDNNGFDVNSLGDFQYWVTNNTGTGTTVNKMVCDDGTGKGIICSHTTSTTNDPLGVAVAANGAAPGTSGSTGVCNIGFCTVVMDNGATANHYAQSSSSVDGDLSDVGASVPTNGQSYWHIVVGNAGAGTTALFRNMTPSELNASSISGGNGRATQIEVNGTTTKNIFNLNATTPAPGAGFVATTVAASNSGNTTSAIHKVAISGNTTTVASAGTMAGGAGSALCDDGSHNITGTGCSSSGVTSLTGDNVLINNSLSTGAVTLTRPNQNAGLVYASPISSAASNIVQSNHTATLGSPTTVAFTSNVAAHNMLIVAYAAGSNAGAVISSTQSDSFSNAVSTAVGNVAFVIAFSCNAVGGSTAINVSNLGNYAIVHIFEVSGAPTSSCNDTNGNTATSPGGGAANSQSATTGGSVAQATELVFGFFGQDTGGTLTNCSVSGAFINQFTDITNVSNHNCGASAFGKVTTGLSGTQSVTFTNNSSGGAGSLTTGIATFKLTTTGAGLPSFQSTAAVVAGLNSNGVVAGGVQTVSGCSLTLPLGGSFAGSFTSGTTGACTVTITPGITAPNGFACTAKDLTTVADEPKQTAYTITTATLSWTTVSGDLVTWSCAAF